MSMQCSPTAIEVNYAFIPRVKCNLHWCKVADFVSFWAQRLLYMYSLINYCVWYCCHWSSDWQIFRESWLHCYVVVRNGDDSLIKALVIACPIKLVITITADDAIHAIWLLVHFCNENWLWTTAKSFSAYSIKIKSVS